MKDETPVKTPINTWTLIKGNKGQSSEGFGVIWGGFWVILGPFWGFSGHFGGFLLPLKQVMKFFTLVSSRKSCGKTGRKTQQPQNPPAPGTADAPRGAPAGAGAVTCP